MQISRIPVAHRITDIVAHCRFQTVKVCQQVFILKQIIITGGSQKEYRLTFILPVERVACVWADVIPSFPRYRFSCATLADQEDKAYSC